MFTFQSLSRSLDLQLSNKKVVEFRAWTYSTKDASIAELIRERVGNDIWEVGSILEHVKLESSEEPQEVKRRRGRPPKNQVVQGMRTTVAAEEKGEST